MKTSTDIPKAPGIYRISIGPRTFYWGQSADLYRRSQEHLYHLRSGDHRNHHLQASFSKHGEAAYKFEVSLLCPVEDLDMQEQFALDIFHGTPGCANVGRCAVVPARGLVRSKETRARISETKSGVPRTAEHSANVWAAQKGVKRSAEACKRIRDGKNAGAPNICVLYTDGTSEVWPSMSALARSLGYTGTGSVGAWLSKRCAIPAKYNIAAVSRTDLPATINPEAR